MSETAALTDISLTDGGEEAVASETENKPKRGVDGSQLVQAQVAHAIGESLRINGARLFGQDQGGLAEDIDAGPEAGRARGR